MSQFFTLMWLLTLLVLTQAKTRDLCLVKPSTSGLCSPTTVGIYYDVETQHCHFMGCSTKRLFATLEDCEKICNNPRHVKRRNNQAAAANSNSSNSSSSNSSSSSSNKANQTTN